MNVEVKVNTKKKGYNKGDPTSIDLAHSVSQGRRHATPWQVMTALVSQKADVTGLMLPPLGPSAHRDYGPGLPTDRQEDGSIILVLGHCVPVLSREIPVLCSWTP